MKEVNALSKPLRYHGRCSLTFDLYDDFAKESRVFSRNFGHYIDTVGSAGRHTSKVAIDKITLCSRVLRLIFHLMAIKLEIFSRLSGVFHCFTRTQLTHFDLTLSITITCHMFVSLYSELQRTLFPRGPSCKHTNASSSDDVLPTPRKQTRRNNPRMQ